MTEPIAPTIVIYYGIELNACVNANHICVLKIENDSFYVYREKLQTINAPEFTADYFKYKDTSTINLLKMLQFLQYHTKEGCDKNLYTLKDMELHENAIRIIENEIEQRSDKAKSISKLIFSKIIKEKENELEVLKKLISEENNNL